jgi:hypothetical protein
MVGHIMTASVRAVVAQAVSPVGKRRPLAEADCVIRAYLCAIAEQR